MILFYIQLQRFCCQKTCKILFFIKNRKFFWQFFPFFPWHTFQQVSCHENNCCKSLKVVQMIFALVFPAIFCTNWAWNRHLIIVLGLWHIEFSDVFFKKLTLKPFSTKNKLRHFIRHTRDDAKIIINGLILGYI